MKRRSAIPSNEREAQAREQSLATLALMRRKHLALTAAAAEIGADPKTVLRYVGSALRQEEFRGPYLATPHDTIPRTLHFITPEGTMPVTVQDSRTASRIAEYMNAVRTYVRYGESSVLETFNGESFETSDGTHQFVTDLETLDHLADAGDLAIDRLYQAGKG